MTAMTGSVQAFIPGILVPPTGTVRTNLFINPSVETNLTDWQVGDWGTGGAGVLERIAGAGPTGGYAARKRWTTANTAGAGTVYVANISYPGRTNVSPGKPYTVSVSVRSSSVETVRLTLIEENSGGTVIGQVNGSSVTTVIGQWVRISSTITTQPTTARIRFAPTLPAAIAHPIGSTIDLDHAMIEQSAAMGGYFDGATPDLPISTVEGIDYAWTGTAHASTSTATPLGRHADVPLGRVEGSGTLDESWAPYMQADLTVALPDDQAILELLDPRELQRVRIDASTAFPGSFASPKSRTFNLGLRSRIIDQGAGIVRLALSTDESLLVDDVWAGTTDNTDAMALSSSIRAIIDQVILSRIGAHLEPGTADAPILVLTDATNLSPNGGFRTNLTGWISNGSSFTRVAGGVPAGVDGTGFARITYASATLNGGILNNGGEQSGPTAVTVIPGKQYTTTMWVRCSVATPVTLNIEWADSASAGLGSTTGPTVNLAANTWTKLTLTATAPVNAARAGTYSYRTAGTSWPAGSTYDATAHLFHEVGPMPVDFFDGDTPDTTQYGYNWAGTPSASVSNRIALLDRPHEALHWRPGVSAWDFIQPLFQSLGFRLFCDELRRWYLVDGAEFIAVPGALQLTMPGNIHDVSDTTDRDGESWFDAAVVRYRWRDPDGTQREQIDSYQAAGYTKVTTIDVDAVFPGPGFAKYAVDRTQGRGRTAEVIALTDLNATPSQPLQITLPATPSLQGMIRQVLFDLNTGTMRISSRGLTDVPAHAIDLLPGTIDALPGTIDSL